MSENTLNRTHPDYDDQYHNWVKMDELYVGSDAVKSASVRYLPMTTSEEKAQRSVGSNKKGPYDRRLQNAVYFNGVDRLIKYAMGHMFQEEPVFAETESDWFENMKSNADLLGTRLSTFIKDVSLKAYLFGHYIVAVDFPNLSGADSRAALIRSNPRPYLIGVNPMEIINWALERTLDGSYQFKWLVHRYSYRESDGPMDEHHTKVYYKIWYKDRWELWVSVLETEDADLDSVAPELVDQGPNPLGFIPYVPVYSQMARFMVSKPPLLESANLNIDHYRIMSAFNHGLMYHLNPILTISGVQAEGIDTGADSALILPRNSKAEYVEFQGRSLNIAKDTSEMILREMWESGMRSSTSLGANTSAEARRLSRSDFQSWLLSVVGSFEDAFNHIIDIASLWAGQPLEVEEPVKMNKDFDLTPMDANEAEFLLNARKAGEISRLTFLNEMKRGERLAKTVDVEEEMSRAEADLAKDLEALAKAEAASQGNQDQPPQNEPLDEGSGPEETEED